jgi:hypothetical protein
VGIRNGRVSMATLTRRLALAAETPTQRA